MAVAIAEYFINPVPSQMNKTQNPAQKPYSMYYNPALHQLELDFHILKPERKIQIYNALGQLVFVSKDQDDKNVIFNTSHLKTGIYLLYRLLIKMRL